MGEKEGAWAREYRQGRAEQVKQQRIANLIALASLEWTTRGTTQKCIDEAYRLLFKED